MTSDSYEYVVYEVVGDGAVVRITLNRPKHRNAQHRPLLVELDDAFRRAEADDEIRVVILSGAGPLLVTERPSAAERSRDTRKFWHSWQPLIRAVR